MNSKKCKALRREARMLSVGMPKTLYMKWANPKFAPIISKTGIITGYKKTAKGVPCRLYKSCERAVYHLLKKGKT